MVSEQLGSSVVGLGSDFFYQGDGVQCELVGFVSRGLISLTQKIRNQLKTIPNNQLKLAIAQSSWKRTSRVLQTNQNYCHHICICSDLQALVFKCIAGCHLVALGHGMLTED